MFELFDNLAHDLVRFDLFNKKPIEVALISTEKDNREVSFREAEDPELISLVEIIKDFLLKNQLFSKTQNRTD